MRFDMHCHTKEGSLDGKVPLRDYVLRLKILGYDGMLITDHNSYKAYRQYTRNIEDEAFKDFVVLKGIEYDTSDGGHILVIMPTDVMFPVLEMRGLPVHMLIELVHSFHGILGPSHPCGDKYLSLTNSKYYHKHPEVITEFDFIEVFNSNIDAEANREALALSEKYHLPGVAGSDSHKLDNIGLAHTDFDCPITSESDLINCIKKSSSAISCGGSHYPGSNRDHLGIIYDFLLRVFYLYNRIGNWYRRSSLEKELAYIFTEQPNLFRRFIHIITITFPDILINRKATKKFRHKVESTLFAGMDEEKRALFEEEMEEELAKEENAQEAESDINISVS